MPKLKDVSTLAAVCLVALATGGFAAEIHEAAANGELDAVAALLREDPELLEARGPRNETPLITAAGAGRKAVVLFLLEAGAKIDPVDTSNRGAIFHPSYTGNDEIVGILLDHGADPTRKDVRGNTPLHWAAVRGKRSTIDLYSRRGYEVTLHEAAACGHIELMEKALAEGARVNDRNEDRSTPAHLAVLGDQQEALLRLIECGADLHLMDKNDLSPFDLAVERERDEIVALLEAKGYGQTPVAAPDVVRLTRGMHRITFPFYMRTNIVVQTGPDGILLVDTGFSRRAVARLKEEIAALRGGEITYLINSHEHWDHVAGNFIAGGATRPISLGVIEQDAAGVTVSRVNEAIPGRTGKGFAFHYALRFNGEEIRLIPFPGLHSENDMLVHFTGSNVVHMGDLLLSQSFPAVSNVPGYLEFLDAAIDVFPEETLFVSGHGRDSSLDDVRNYAKMLRETRDIVVAARAAGRTLAEIQEQKILGDYESWGAFLTFLNTDSWSRAIFNSCRE